MTSLLFSLRLEGRDAGVGAFVFFDRGRRAPSRLRRNQTEARPLGFALIQQGHFVIIRRHDPPPALASPPSHRRRNKVDVNQSGNGGFGRRQGRSPPNGDDLPVVEPWSLFNIPLQRG